MGRIQVEITQWNESEAMAEAAGYRAAGDAVFNDNDVREWGSVSLSVSEASSLKPVDLR